MIVVSSGTIKQANEVLLKIENIFMKQSSILRQEILVCKVGQNDAIVVFRNTIKTIKTIAIGVFRNTAMATMFQANSPEGMGCIWKD